MSWDRRPLHELVYSIIGKNKTISYEDLLSQIREIFKGIGTSELKNVLIKLEIWGKIDVVTEGDTRKIILRGEEGGR
ncbi:MAG: hypothetical protein ACE5GD_05995 [Candidatus Geothermarchaeales archaeon]